MKITATELRATLYRVLDKVLESGEPVEIERKGKRLKIVLDAPIAKLDHLERRDGYLKADPDSLVHLDWSSEWKA